MLIRARHAGSPTDAHEPVIVHMQGSSHAFLGTACSETVCSHASMPPRPEHLGAASLDCEWEGPIGHSCMAPPCAAHTHTQGGQSLTHGAATFSSSHCLGDCTGIAHPAFLHTRRANGAMYKDDSTYRNETPPSRASRLLLPPPSPSRLPFPFPPEGTTRSCQSGRWGL